MKLLFLVLMSLSTSTMADGFRDDCYHIYVGTYIPVCNNPKVEVPKTPLPPSDPGPNLIGAPKKESNHVDIDRALPMYQNIYDNDCMCVHRVLRED